MTKRGKAFGCVCAYLKWTLNISIVRPSKYSVKIENATILVKQRFNILVFVQNEWHIEWMAERTEKRMWRAHKVEMEQRQRQKIILFTSILWLQHSHFMRFDIFQVNKFTLKSNFLCRIAIENDEVRGTEESLEEQRDILKFPFWHTYALCVWNQ